MGPGRQGFWRGNRLIAAAGWTIMLAACWIDGQSIQAALLVERCRSAWPGGVPELPTLDHLFAFPLASIAMTLMCFVQAPHAGAWRWRKVTWRLVLMAMSMIPACALSAAFASLAPLRMGAVVYGLVMTVSASGLAMFVEKAGFSRTGEAVQNPPLVH